MRAGTLRHWLTFENLIVELDSDGAKVETWVPAWPLSPRMPAEVTALSGRELLAAQAVHSKVSTRIVVRYRPGFDAKMRATTRDVIWNVEAVIPDAISRVRYVTLLCSSGVSDGA